MYFDEMTLALDERRHGNVLNMPLATSIRQLQEVVTERLKKKFPKSNPRIPSHANPFTGKAIRYTGRFKVKCGVQVRQLRKDHPDCHYVSALLQYVEALLYSTVPTCC